MLRNVKEKERKIQSTIIINNSNIIVPQICDNMYYLIDGAQQRRVDKGFIQKLLSVLYV